MTTWNLQGTKHHILICNGSSCMRKGGEEVTQAIRDEIKQLELDEIVHTTRTRCNGRCKDACVTVVYPEGTWYKALTEETGREIVRSHIGQGNILKESVIYTYEQEGFVAPENSDSIDGISKKVKEEV